MLQNILNIPCQNKPKLKVQYNDAALYYGGRWTDIGTGKQCGWNGAYVRFKVKNTSSIKVTASYNITGTTPSSFLTNKIDNDPIETPQIYFYAGGATEAGTKTLTIPCINDGNYHEIVLHFGGSIAMQFQQTSITVFNNLEFDAGATIAPVTNGAKMLQFISDSWCGPINDYPRLIDNTLYNIYPISAGAGTAANADTNYNYSFSGILSPSDPIADAVVIEFGVNEYSLGTSVAAFQTSLLSLIDKVRIRQPSSPIFLIRVPNLGASLYGQYYTAMVNASLLRTDIITIDTSSLDASLTWKTDNAHLDGASKQVFANFVKAQLISNGI